MDDHQIKWDGALQFLSQSAACQGLFPFADNDRVRYHPRLGENRPFSAFTRFRGNEETELVVISEGQQFHGRGDYIALKLGGGFPGGAQGRFDFTQTPAQVTQDTPFVSFVGSLDHYGGIEGCRVTLQANMTRVDPEFTHTPKPPRK